MDMTTNENTSSQTDTHKPECRIHDSNPGGISWGCTCNWNEQDDEWLRRVTR